MDTDALRTLLAVARAGSFAALARERGLDPSSVSRAVADVERRLGVRVFQRTTRRLAPTEAGRVFLARIAPLLDGLDEAADAARDSVAEPSGLLRLTASVALGERWLIPRLAPFRAAHPLIEFDLALTDRVVDLLAEGVDLALRLGPDANAGDGMVAAKLFGTRYRVVAAPAYLRERGAPVEPSDLGEHDAIVFPLPGYRSRWRLRGANGTEDATPRPVLSVSNALAVRRAALEGLGVALLAEWTVADDLASGALVDLFPDHEASAADFNTALWVVYPSRAALPRRARLLIDHLRASV